MFGQDETAKPGNRRQARHEDRLSRAAGQDTRMLFLGKAIQDVDAIGDTDTDDQGKGHDIGRIQWNSKKAHQPPQPDRADSHGQQGQHN